tara:strand:- start:3567 stop:4451 length:885 start_codon:yes stop_codon:yes gene_type:complete
MSKINYVSIDRIFSKINRDIKGTETNETDVIEWIGEALEFLKVPQILVEDVAFLTVSDYHVEMPENLHMITQIARNNTYDSTVPTEECEEIEEEISTEDSCAVEEAVDLGLWSYTIWTSGEEYRKNYSPVRLATGSFFNNIVCKEKDESLYTTCEDEYTIVGEIDKLLRFNFIEGQIAVSYLRNTVDESGYPLIPDNISYITAIVYYLKWKIAEWYEWSGREGWSAKAEKAEARWIKYSRQGKNFMKMPKTLDEHQNLLEQTHYLIPNHKRYYEYFGNLGKRDVRNFNTFNKRN